MIRKFLARFSARGAEERHPDLTFDDVEAPPQEMRASRPAKHVPTLDGHDLHPDFDFDPGDAEPISVNVQLQPFRTEISQSIEELDVLVPDLVPDNETRFWDNPDTDEEPDSIPDWAPDPLDFAISLGDVAKREEDEPPHIDWYDDPIEVRDEARGQETEPLDIFDFDISDLEAEFEAEPVVPETLSARDQRLD